MVLREGWSGDGTYVSGLGHHHRTASTLQKVSRLLTRNEITPRISTMGISNSWTRLTTDKLSRTSKHPQPQSGICPTNTPA